MVLRSDCFILRIAVEAYLDILALARINVGNLSELGDVSRKFAI
jgi:hypothetical protein